MFEQILFQRNLTFGSNRERGHMFPANNCKALLPYCQGQK
jgi:hypothetical protein